MHGFRERSRYEMFCRRLNVFFSLSFSFTIFHHPWTKQLSEEKLKQSDLENRIEELEFSLELEKKNLLKKKIHQ